MDIEKGKEFSQWIRKKRLKFTRSALRSTVGEMIKNPDIYLWAMAVKLCQDAGKELESVKSEALEIQVQEKISYDELEALVASL